MTMLETKIEALTKAVEALTAQLAATAPVAEKPAKAEPAKVEPAKVEPAKVEPADASTNKGTMTMEEMTRAALALSRDGKGNDVRKMLKSLGVTRISLLDADQLVDFEAFLKGLGQ